MPTMSNMRRRKIQARQYVEGEQVEMDVLACAMAQGAACVLLLSFRNGMNLGTRSFFPKLNGAESEEEVLSAFVGQYYLEKRPPREIVLGHAIADIEWRAAILCLHHVVSDQPCVCATCSAFLAGEVVPPLYG